MPTALSGPRLLQIKAISRAHLPGPGESDQADEKEAAHPGKESGGLKRELVGFSQQSRLNLSKKLACVSSPDPLAHITLTYGPTSPRSQDDLRREKDVVRITAARLGLYGFVVLEFQRARHGLENDFLSMVPHFHFLAWAPDPNSWSRFARWWRRHTANPEDAAVTIREGDEAKASWYFMWHSSKDDQSPPFAVGRWWFVVGKEKVQAHSRLVEIAAAVLDREVIWLKRIFRRKTGCRGSLGPQGFSWFLPEQEHARVLTWAKRQVDFEQGFTGNNPF